MSHLYDMDKTSRKLLCLDAILQNYATLYIYPEVMAKSLNLEELVNIVERSKLKSKGSYRRYDGTLYNDQFQNS